MSSLAPAVTGSEVRIGTGPDASLAPDTSRPKLLSDPVVLWILAFCAVVPIDGSPFGWVVVALLSISQLVAHRGQLFRMQVCLPLCLYLSWMMLSLVWSVEPATTATELFMNMNFVMLGLLVSVNRSVGDLLRIFVHAATWLLLVCWVVTLLVPSFGRMESTEYVGAMRGLFVEKNMLGYFSVVAFVAALCLALAPDSRGKTLLRRWGPAAVAISTVLSSTSKTALTVCGAIVLAGYVFHRLATGRRPLALPLMAWLTALVGLVALVWSNWALLLNALGRDATLTGRTKIWQVVISAIVERPIFGYGWKALWLEDSPTTIRLWARNYRVPFFHAHNGYLDLAAQLGLVGLGLALLFLLWLLVRSARGFFALPTSVTAWPLLMVVVVLLYNFTEVVSFTNTTWVLLVALSSILTSQRKPKQCTSHTRYV